MNYNQTARRIVDRSIKNALRGTRFTTYRVKSKGCEPVVLSHYIQRRAPKTRVMLELERFNDVTIVVYSAY